jgi:hypothetical protein
LAAVSGRGSGDELCCGAADADDGSGTFEDGAADGAVEDEGAEFDSEEEVAEDVAGEEAPDEEGTGDGDGEDVETTGSVTAGFGA